MSQPVTPEPHGKPNLDYRAKQMKRYKALPREDQRYIDGAITTLLYKAGLAPEIGKRVAQQPDQK